MELHSHPAQDSPRSSAVAVVDSVVNLQRVSMTFGGDQSPVLAELSLTVRRGEFLTVVGPSGGGKSTLLRLIAGLLQPTTGNIQIASSPAASLDSPDSSSPPLSFGFVFQQPTLLPWRTAAQNLLLPLELEGVRKSHIRRDEAATLAMLRRVGLSEADASKRPAELSGGMQMRLSLARALMAGPDVLLLDEPLAAVDDLLRMRLQEDVRRIHDELHLTTILVTHNLLEAVFMSDRVLILTGRPARVRNILPIHTRMPRDQSFRRSSECHALTGQLTAEMLAMDIAAH